MIWIFKKSGIAYGLLSQLLMVSILVLIIFNHFLSHSPTQEISRSGNLAILHQEKY